MHIRTHATLCLFLGAASLARAQQAPNCHIGSYRLTNGTLIDISYDNGEVGDTLRWIDYDGQTGGLYQIASGAWTSTKGFGSQPDGKVISLSDCRTGHIQFDGVSGQRVPLEIRDTTFESHGVKLAGRLVMPVGTDKVPITVFAHGADPGSALDGFFLQRILPAEGIGAFVFDKRGTAKSEGKYTQDYNVLADDLVAAMRVARRMAGSRLGRIGYQGGSQAGWVEPLAANRAPVDFVIVCYGLAVNVIDEDQEAVELQMRERGYTADEIAAGKAVARAVENVFASNFTSGYAQLDSLRDKYRQARWYKHLEGDYTWIFLPKSEKEIRAMAPKFDWHVPWDYDPMPVLRSNTVPQLWILGGEDYQAPSAETRQRLNALMADGRPFTIGYYPHAEHVMTLFERAADGSRVPTRFAPGYFRMIRDFAVDGRLHGAYGDAQVTTRGG